MTDMIMSIVEISVALAIVAVIIKQFVMPLYDSLKKKKESQKEVSKQEVVKNDGTT